MTRWQEGGAPPLGSLCHDLAQRSSPLCGSTSRGGSHSDLGLEHSHQLCAVVHAHVCLHPLR
jgi:hypothetical protein